MFQAGSSCYKATASGFCKFYFVHCIRAADIGENITINKVHFLYWYTSGYLLRSGKSPVNFIFGSHLLWSI